jgi:hypothetical protein
MVPDQVYYYFMIIFILNFFKMAPVRVPLAFTQVQDFPESIAFRV